MACMFISHLWFVNDGDVLYSGHIINVKSSKVTIIVLDSK